MTALELDPFFFFVSLFFKQPISCLFFLTDVQMMFTVVTTTSGKSYNHDVAMLLLCKKKTKNFIQTSFVLFCFNFGKKRVLQSSFVTCNKLYA